MYKDGNHKPEMALALTDFEALCGFVEAAQLTAALEGTPELRGIVGDAMSALVASTGDTGLRWAGVAASANGCLANGRGHPDTRGRRSFSRLPCPSQMLANVSPCLHTIMRGHTSQADHM